jgi:hypothetical protein
VPSCDNSVINEAAAVIRRLIEGLLASQEQRVPVIIADDRQESAAHCWLWPFVRAGGPCAGTISVLVLMANRQLRPQGRRHQNQNRWT